MNNAFASPDAIGGRMDATPEVRVTAPEDDSLFAMARNFAIDIWRRRLVIAGSIFISLAISFYLITTTAPTFKSTFVGVFEIEPVDPTAQGAPADRTPSGMVLNTAIQILTSRTLAEKLIEKLDLQKDPYFNPYLVGNAGAFSLGQLVGSVLGGLAPSSEPRPDQIRQRIVDVVLASIRVGLVGESFAFAISAEAPSAERSAEIANAMIEIYTSERSARRAALSENAAEFAEQRLSALQETLRLAERQTAVVRAEAPPGAESDLVELSRQIFAVRETADAADARRRDAENRIIALSVARAAGDVNAAMEAAGPPWLGGLRRDLLEARAALAGGGEAASRAFAERLDGAANVLSDAASAAAERAAALNAELEELQEKYDRQSRALLDLREFERQAAAARSAYETLLIRTRERPAGSAFDPLLPEARVLSAAIPPRRPTAPRKNMLIAFGVIGGAAVGGALAILLNALYPVIGSAADVTRLACAAPLARLSVSGRGGSAAFLERLRRGRETPRSSEFRKLVAEIALRRGDRGPGLVLVSSLVDSPERANLTVGFCHALAREGWRTILVKADPDSSTLPERGRSDGSTAGFDAVLTGVLPVRDAIENDPATGFDRLTAHGDREQSLRLLLSTQLAAVLRSLSESYDAVIVETPAVLTYCNARFMASYADLVLIGVREGKDKPNDLRDAVTLMSRTTAPVEFVMMTNA